MTEFNNLKSGTEELSRLLPEHTDTSSGPEDITPGYHNRYDALVGPHMKDTEVSSTRAMIEAGRVMGPQERPERPEYTVTPAMREAAEVFQQSVSPDVAQTTEEFEHSVFPETPIHPNSHITIDVEKEVKDAAKVTAFGAASGALIAGGMATAIEVAQGVPLAGTLLVAAPAAAIAGAYAGLSVLTTYAAGIAHNVIWKNTGESKPGKIGTFVRGMLAPVTIPVGVAWRMLGNG